MGQRKLFPFKSGSLSLWLRERTPDLFITLAGLVVALSATIYVHFLTPPSLERNSKVVNILAGTNFHEIARVLEENGIVRDPRSFYLLARFESPGRGRDEVCRARKTGRSERAHRHHQS